MTPTNDYDEEMASPSSLHNRSEDTEGKEEELGLQLVSESSLISSQAIVTALNHNKKPSTAAAGLQFFGQSKRDKQGTAGKVKEDDDDKEATVVHEVQKQSAPQNDPILDEIQPFPLQRNTVLSSSQPGAYARRTASPRPFASPNRPQSQEDRPTGGPQPPQDHLVEASLVEETPIDVPLAEIVQSRDETPEQPRAEPKVIPKSRRLLFGILAILTIAMVGLAVAGITCGTGHCTNTSSVSALPTDLKETAPPAVSAPTSSSPPLELSDISVPLKDGMARVPLADTNIDLPLYTMESMKNSSFAQARAIHWLATEYDHTALFVMEEWRKQQLFVLATLYFSLSGGGGGSQESEGGSWLNPLEPECNWTPKLNGKGDLVLQCTDMGQIKSLRFRDFRQTPILPRELELLPSLKRLYIENSGMGGTLEDLIPQTIVSSLSDNLMGLILANNGLRGTIPVYFMELTKLNKLELDRNVLSGSVPTEVGLLTKLDSMSIFGNKLSGPIPSEMGKLTELEYLSAIWNELSGTLPSELGLLQAMSSLSLLDNRLEGPIPSQLGHLQNCEELGVAKNKLTGTLPTELGLLNKMTSLTFFDNQLEGKIPSELGMNTQIVCLDPADNRLTGELPSQLGLLTKLTRLGLYENDLTGSLPTQLGFLTALRDLWIQENGIHGLLPSQLGLLSDLAWLSAHSNKLEGEIPSQLGQLAQLEILDLSSNSLSGLIPTQLGHSVKLNKLSLLFNNLEGFIPSELGMLIELEHLWLQENDLSGIVPESVCVLTQDTHSGLYDFALDCLEEVLCPSNCSCISCS